MLNLDTHIVIFFLQAELTESEYDHVVSQDCAISGIVLWELAKLAARRRVSIDLDGLPFQALLRTLTVLPITVEIARRSTQLDFASDPADEIIAATSLVESIPLLTRDRRIRRSRIVPLAL